MEQDFSEVRKSLQDYAYDYNMDQKLKSDLLSLSSLEIPRLPLNVSSREYFITNIQQFKREHPNVELSNDSKHGDPLFYIVDKNTNKHINGPLHYEEANKIANKNTSYKLINDDEWKLGLIDGIYRFK